MSDTITEQQICLWLDNVLLKENIEKYTINICGPSLQGEGYGSDIKFAKINGKKKSNQEDVNLDIIVKVSKVDMAPGNENIQEIFKREVLVYNKIFPAFKKLVTERKADEYFNFVPKCYQAIFTDQKIVIILDNLGPKGYVGHNRFETMNIAQIKLILKMYAKFHAISFAFKDQNGTEFKKLLENYFDVFDKFMLEGPVGKMFQPNAISTNNLIKTVDEELSIKINKFIEKGILNILKEIFKDAPVESVIKHGDCWSSNFLFKYDIGDKEHPTDVVIVDWQASTYHSPALDLAYFLSCVSSKEQVAHFDELLVYYHDQLSYCISELGSNPNELFPFSTFLEHWKKYSLFALVAVLSFLPLILRGRKDEVKSDDFENEEDMLKAIKETKAKNNNLLLERVLAVARYYFELNKNNA